jgi:two-component system sensor histidine kinase QseC
MKSIRLYLLLVLLSGITLMTFLSLLQGYQSSLQKAEQLFDTRLKNMAEIIANANQDTEPRIASVFEQSPTVFFQVWSNESDLLAHSNNAPSKRLFDFDGSGSFSEHNFNGYRWRTFLLRDHHLNRWVVVAERSDIRYILAENVILASIKPIVVTLPILALIIWLAIGLGLKPLQALNKQLGEKQADDLSPIKLDETPKELSQLISTVNALFSRLNASFTREQQFSADAAHELRTPLSNLKVQMHNLQMNKSIDKQLLLPMATGIDRMSHVVEQVLALYRHSADHQLIQQVQLDLYALIQGVIAEQYSAIHAKKQTISIKDGEKSLVMGNEFALKTMFQYLINNAHKYSPQGSQILITLKGDSKHIRCVIEDSGPGISQSEYQRVFERFYRVGGDQHNTGVMGCGLGLAIVHHIAELHRAKLDLMRSDELGGLKVVIEFPLNKGI